MSFYDDASLVLIPSGYKAGKVYSQKPLSTDGELTFTRASHATRVNVAGNVEKARTNNLLQSNTFSTTWSAVNATVTSGQSDRDGGTDAWLLDKTASDGRVQQSISVTGVYTISVYAKKGTTDFIKIRFAAASNVLATFDLNNGTVGSTTSDVHSSIAASTGGYYRCSVVMNLSSGTVVQLYAADNSAGATSATSGNIYIQDAQLEQGLVATDSIETTTAAVTVGIYNDVPRLDYSGGASCPALLLEPQRSNLIVQSEGFTTTAWMDNRVNTNVTANATSSPEGLQNAAEIEFTSSGAYIFDQFTNVASSMHIGSVWLKNKDIGSIRLRMEGGAPSIYGKVDVNIEEGTISNPQGDFTPTIEDYGDGWYRVAIGDTGTATIASPQFSFDYLSGTGSFYAYGAQLEAGSYPTSYIPTYGSTVTRSEDECSKTGISSLIGQAEGTMFADVDLTHSSPSNQYLLQVSASSSNRFFLYRESTTNKVGCYALVGGAAIFTDLTTSAESGRVKVAFAYKSGDFAFYVNGTQVGTSAATYATPPSMGRLDIDSNIGAENGHFEYAKAILFTTRLSNADLATLTT